VLVAGCHWKEGRHVGVVQLVFVSVFFILFSFDSHLVAEGGHLLVLLVILVIPVDILLVLCFCQRLEKGGYLLVVARAAKVDELVLIIFIGASVPVLYGVSHLGVLFVYLVCCLDLKG